MAIFGTPGDDTKDGTELADSMYGLSGDDELHGKGGNDLLSGDDGNDKLFGEADNDLLFGGLDVGRDSDTLDGGGGVDTVTYGQVQHGMDVDLGAGSALARDPRAFGDGNTDALVAVENVIGTNKDDGLAGDGGANSLSGSGGNDVLVGLGGNDKLSGGLGEDVLEGGAGVDTLAGGAGGLVADNFRFRATSDSGVGLGNRDVAADFVSGVDQIDLRFVDAGAGTPGKQGFEFISKGGFTAEGQVRFFFEGDHTVVALNTSGTSGAEAQIELTGQVNLAQGDFVLDFIF
jgi:Ca2+-binding RTX toxin-like protein